MPNFELQAKANAWIFFGPILMGGVLVLLLPAGPNGAVAIIAGTVGTWCILKSKFVLKNRTHKLIE